MFSTCSFLLWCWYFVFVFTVVYYGFTLRSTQRRRDFKTLFSLRMISCFPSALRRRNLKTKQFPVILGLCLRKTRAGKSHDYRRLSSFSKRSVFKKFPSTPKRKSGIFKFVRLEEHLRKALFSWRTSVSGRPVGVEKKALFSNFSNVVWTLCEGEEKDDLYFLF